MYSVAMHPQNMSSKVDRMHAEMMNFSAPDVNVNCVRTLITLKLCFSLRTNVLLSRGELKKNELGRLETHR